MDKKGVVFYCFEEEKLYKFYGERLKIDTVFDSVINKDGYGIFDVNTNFITTTGLQTNQKMSAKEKEEIELLQSLTDNEDIKTWLVIKGECNFINVFKGKKPVSESNTLGVADYYKGIVTNYFTDFLPIYLFEVNKRFDIEKLQERLSKVDERSRIKVRFNDSFTIGGVEDEVFGCNFLDEIREYGVLEIVSEGIAKKEGVAKCVLKFLSEGEGIEKWKSSLGKIGLDLESENTMFCLLFALKEYKMLNFIKLTIVDEIDKRSIDLANEIKESRIGCQIILSQRTRGTESHFINF